MSSVKDSAEQKQHWLIKSGERILGPFTTKEVENMLRSKEVVVIDEITRPGKKWRYIREVASFTAVVEEIRKNAVTGREDIDEKTTGGTVSSTDPDVKNEFQKHSDQDAQEVTAHPVDFGPHVIPPERIQDAEFTSEQHLDSSKAGGNPLDGAVRSYGMSNNEAVRDSAQKSGRVLWLFTMLVILIGGVLVYRMQEKPVPESPVTPDFAKLMENGRTAERQGSWNGALEDYQKALQLRPKSVPALMRMAPLSLRIDRHTAEIKRLVSEATSGEVAPEFQIQGALILGIAAFMEDDHSEAKSNFEKALKLDNQNDIANFNLGAIDFADRNWLLAASHLDPLAQKDSADTASLLMSVINKLEFTRTGPTGNQHSEMEERLQILRTNHVESRQESFLLSAVVANMFKREEIVQMAVRQALQSDPFLTEETVTDPLLLNHFLSWENLSKYCDQLSAAQPQNPELLALHSICLLKAGRTAEVEKEIAKAVAEAPGSSLVQAAHAFILEKQGKEEEAKATIKMAMDPTPSPLARVISARLCMRNQDFACAGKLWQEVLNDDSRSVAAVTGLANIAIKQGRLDDAKKFLAQGKTMSNQYAPLIVLENKMAEGPKAKP